MEEPTNKPLTLKEMTDWLQKDWYAPREHIVDIGLGLEQWRRVASDPDDFLHSLMTKEQCKVPNCTVNHKTL